MVNPDWQRLVEENLDLARSVAWRYARKGLASRDPAIDLDDLMASAFEGLVWAAKRYDPSLGHQFSTYAVPAIMGRILKAFRHHQRGLKLPIYLHPSRRPSVCSLDTPLGEGEETDLGDLVATTGRSEVEDAALARQALARLPVHMRHVLMLRAGGWTQREVSQRLGVSQPHISRLERSAKWELLQAIGK